ncbi:MAG: hypothetical protein JOY53_18355 [Acidobacteriaceae bacterium]|nr:hypothetical protein [Acidobacteriaceae bacterium]
MADLEDAAATRASDDALSGEHDRNNREAIFPQVAYVRKAPGENPVVQYYPYICVLIQQEISPGNKNLNL